MRPRQTALFIVLLLATLGCFFSVFLPDSDRQGPSPGLAERLEPIAAGYRAREVDAANGRFASNADMTALRSQLEIAERFTPAFSSENSQAADDEARSAVNAYADFVESIVAQRIRPVDDRAKTRNTRLTTDVARALKAGTGAGITRLKAWLVQLALFVLLPATFLVAFLPAALGALRDAGIRRSGNLMHGIVVSATPTGMMTNYVPQYRATIRLDDGSTSGATLTAYSGLPEGADVMVKVSRDRRTAIIDSLKVNGATEYTTLR